MSPLKLMTVALVAVAMVGLSGYVAGSAGAPEIYDAQSVKRSAYAESYGAASSSSMRRARASALRRESKLARAKTRRRGEQAGTKDGRAALAERLTEQQAPAPSPCDTIDEMAHGYCLRKFGLWDGVQ